VILVTYCIIFFCLYIGLLYPCLAILGYDVYAKKSKTLTTIIRWRRRSKDIWQNRYLNNILQIVAPLIPLSESSEKKMNDNLKRADIPYNAKEYYAKAILSACLGILVTVFATTLNSTILVIGGILMTIYLFFKNYDEVNDILQNKAKLLEDEIPTFVRSIESGLHTDRDIIRGFERYKKIASPAMASELDIVIADMQASSVAQGLMRFDNRLNSPEISRLCAALIEVDRGIDNSMTLQYLAQDMTTMHRQIIQRELDKRPGQMKRAILPAGIILVVMMFYILIEAVIRSAATLL
jgi:flagellar protein FlaJ